MIATRQRRGAPAAAPTYWENRLLHGGVAVLILAAFSVALAMLVPVDVEWDVQALVNDRRSLKLIPVSVRALDWYMALVTLPTAAHHLYMASRSPVWWQAYVAGRFSLVRWAEYTVTSTAMTTRIAVLSGVADLGSLLCIAGMSAATIALGGVFEYLMAIPGDPKLPASTLRSVAWNLFGISSALFVAHWGVILGTFIAAASGSGDVPAWVYSAFVGVLLLDLGFPAVAIYSALRPRRPYQRVDMFYSLLSIFVKQFYIYLIAFGFASYQRLDPVTTTVASPAFWH